MAATVIDSDDTHQLHVACDLVTHQTRRPVDPDLPGRGERKRLQHMDAAVHFHV